MRCPVRSLPVLALAVLMQSCSSKPVEPETVVINVTPSASSVRADGKASVEVSIERPGSVDVKLRAVRGTWKETGTTNFTVLGGTGTATLVTCDSRATLGCAGQIRVSAASDDDATGTTTVNFLQVELCDNGKDDDANQKIDCEDPDCVAQRCKLPTGAVGTGLCNDQAACVCSTGVLESCVDGVDNNCDGKADCEDTTCDAKLCTLPSGSGGRCLAAACKCPGTAEVCGSGIDDDCDGKIDCGDTDCQATGGNLGKPCDLLGHTCSAPNGEGVATCSYCPGGQTSETLCTDATDNDCDGLTDCEDPDCDRKTCAANGKVCDAVNKLCVCGGNGAAPEATETTCDDLGRDNDCDGKGDCADTDCTAGGGQVCGTFGKRCLALNTCSCGAVAEDCATPGDDNCNGLTNCEEVSCRPSGVSAGKLCDASGNTCSQVIGGVSACTTCSGNGGTAEATEGMTGGSSMTCGDAKDNDCDGTALLPSTDCQDQDCDAKPCNAFGGQCVFANKACGCPSGRSAETGLCANSLDDDCDGKIDCVDPDCQPFGGNPGGACGSGNGFRCTAASACACSGNGGTAQVGTETLCSDSRDNDCDGVTDCADSNCQPVGNNLGAQCDARGNTCSVPASGISSCTVCSGNGGPAQTSEYLCGDGKDNDCDGTVDCQDTGCDVLACTATGKLCSVGALTCNCPGAEAGGEVSCSDGRDNDCDGLSDCADPNCQPVGGNPARACSATGHFCNAAGACACLGNGGVVEATEGATAVAQGQQPTCGDGKDNDCDGLVDCSDSNCRPAPPATPTGRDCSTPLATPATIGKQCDITGSCICPGGQAAEASCSDGLDNDCDGLVDCADADCLAKTCSATGKTCSATSTQGCTCPSGLSIEATCSNNVDDDCDGKADCADPDCVGQQCLGVSADYKCSVATPSVCKDINQANTLVLVASRARIPADGAATSVITATLTGLTGPVPNATVSFVVTSGGGSVSPASADTNAQGQVTTTFTAASATAGVSTITGTSVVSGSTTVDQPRLGQVRFVSQQYSLMGVRSSSFQETNLLTFQLLDSSNAPYPAGLVVSFSHRPAGGSFIGSTPTCDLGQNLCSATGTTDASGFVSVILHSGKVASIVSVDAQAMAGGATANASVSNIAIVGAKASGLSVAIDCTPKNVPAFNSATCLTSNVAATVSCRVAFADRFNNVLGVATLATFTSEAGAAGQPSMTSPATGVATGAVAVNGFRLPTDVEPLALPDGGPVEPFVNYSLGSCAVTKHNPRDGLVTIIVSANGEEGFFDSNGDGVYSAGENFIDLAEPFVDEDDNGARNGNEQYVDSNNNGAWDGPNGLWDANTVIWAETRVVYSGPAASVGDGPAGTELLSRWYWLNQGGALPGPTAPPDLTHPFGVPLLQSKVGPPVVPATTATVGVFLTDANLNVLTASTAFNLSVVPVAGAQVSAAWASVPASPDSLGMSFTQQFCQAPVAPAPVDPLTCSSSCVYAPCVIRSSVGGFVTGNRGTAIITGAGGAGLSEVRAAPNTGTNPMPVPIRVETMAW